MKSGHFVQGDDAPAGLALPGAVPRRGRSSTDGMHTGRYDDLNTLLQCP